MKPPSANQVHFWSVADIPEVAALLPLLSADERLRYARISAPRVQSQFLQTRLALRRILSLYNPHVAPSHWRFQRNAYGRPELLGEFFDDGMVFNISHARGALVIAFSAAGELGVDVEFTQRKARALAVAQRYFSPTEVQDLYALAEGDRRARFFDLWTLKEAYIKACGMGLAIPLASFSYLFTERGIAVQFARERNDDAARWQFWQLRLGPSHQAAIAYGGSAPVSKAQLCGYRLCAWDEVQEQALAVLRRSEGLV